MEALSPAGRATRLALTMLGALVLLAGSLWGSDDNFPFGPFSMYAGVNGPNDPAPDTRIEGTDITGATVVLTERNAGVRRAEIEGEEAQFVADPGRLSRIADAYRRLNPDAPVIVRVALVVRWHEIRNSSITGHWRDEVKAVWERRA
jgi:hypothetical protein